MQETPDRSLRDPAAAVIGRREVLAAAAAPWFVRSAGAADVARFELGIASGQPRADGIVLWTRLTGDELPPRVDVQWELAHDEAFTRVAARGVEVAEAASVHCVHAEPTGLDADRWYFYRFRALGQQSPVGRTRTAPPADARARLRTAIASCQRWDHGHFAAWRHLATQDLDVVMFLGDYIYEYASPPGRIRAHEGSLLRTLDDFRRRYAQYKRDPALQAAHAAFPWLLIWDDHEVENDYAGGAEATPSGAPTQGLLAAAYQAYWEHMPFPKSQAPRDGTMRIVGRLDWGRLARIHLLDDRQYRDLQVCPQPNRSGGSNTVMLADCPSMRDPARTLLGREQERWLAEGWSIERPWNLVAQQTLMARFKSHPDGRYWTDGWDGYPAARARLLGTVAERKVGGVVVLGGDVHAHFIADLKADYDEPRSPVIASEFCGSSITSQGRQQRGLDALLPLNPHLHYARSDQRGTMIFDIDDKQLKARVMAVDKPDDPMSAVTEAARFVVDPARPGPQRG